MKWDNDKIISVCAIGMTLLILALLFSAGFAKQVFATNCKDSGGVLLNRDTCRFPAGAIVTSQSIVSGRWSGEFMTVPMYRIGESIVDVSVNARTEGAPITLHLKRENGEILNMQQGATGTEGKLSSGFEYLASTEGELLFVEATIYDKASGKEKVVLRKGIEVLGATEPIDCFKPYGCIDICDSDNKKLSNGSCDAQEGMCYYQSETCQNGCYIDARGKAQCN